MGREGNTGRRSDIRAQRAGMIPCVPSQNFVRLKKLNDSRLSFSNPHLPEKLNDFRRLWGRNVFRSQKLIGEKVARFRQIKMEEPIAHHDVGVRGQIVLLTRLCEGQHATVLQLPALPKTPAETDAQTRVAHVG